jgi:hypothetical protein
MRFFLYLLGLILLSSCATQPVVLEGSKTKGNWQTKALLRDLKKQKSNSLSIDFVAFWPDRLRAEITGPFGVSVASLAIGKEQMQLAIHTQKKFYYGKVSEKSLSGLLGIPLDPRILINILFDVAPPGASWNCHMDVQSLLQDCKNRDNGISIHWSERHGELKRVVISREDYEIQILVKDFNTKVQESADYFTILHPDSYVSYQID